MYLERQTRVNSVDLLKILYIQSDMVEDEYLHVDHSSISTLDISKDSKRDLFKFYILKAGTINRIIE